VAVGREAVGRASVGWRLPVHGLLPTCQVRFEGPGMGSDPLPGNRIRGVDPGVVGSGIDSGCRRLSAGGIRSTRIVCGAVVARGCWRSMVNVSLSAGGAVDPACRPANGSGRDERVGNGLPGIAARGRCRVRRRVVAGRVLRSGPRPGRGGCGRSGRSRPAGSGRPRGCVSSPGRARRGRGSGCGLPRK
jgi:hypothetical protein